MYSKHIRKIATKKSQKKQTKKTKNCKQQFYDEKVFNPYKSEFDYMSKCSGIPISDLVLLNLLYDMTAFCTSIVAQDSNGNIWHGRNLDYGFPILRNLTYIVNYTMNGKLLFTGYCLSLSFWFFFLQIAVCVVVPFFGKIAIYVQNGTITHEKNAKTKQKCKKKRNPQNKQSAD